MNVRDLCLAILSFGDATGYEIRKQSTEGKYSHFVEASYGAIYPALNKLEEDGLVTCREETQTGKPPRKVYSITAEGREALIHVMTQPLAPDTYRSPFLLLAMLAPMLPKDAVAAAVDRHIGQLEDELALIEAIRQDEPDVATSWVCDLGSHCVGVQKTYLSEHRAALVEIAGQMAGASESEKPQRLRPHAAE